MKITLKNYEIIDILSVEADGTHLVFDIEVDSKEHAFYATSPDGAVGVSHNSATISLSDLNSEEMSLAKSGQWWVDNPQRALANNSAIYTEKPAKEIFLKEWKNLKESGSGERGIFNREGAKNNSKKHGRILKENSGLNPCVTGDTFIAVADGRGYVKMSDLVEAGEDVDVYTVKNGELVIRKMVNPRLTGKNVPIVKVNFTNGIYIKVTPNHKLILKNGRKIPVIDLKPQDEIESLTMRNNLRGFGKPCDLQSGYRNLRFGNRNIQEARLLYSHYNNESVIKGMAYNIHHKDENKLNNSKDNLQKISLEEHALIHRESKIGANNPYNRLRNPSWDKKLKMAAYGERNANTNEIETKEIIKILQTAAQNEQYMSKIDFDEFLKKNKIPLTFTRLRKFQSGYNNPRDIYNHFSCVYGYKGHSKYQKQSCVKCSRFFFTHKDSNLCSACSINLNAQIVELRSSQSKIYNDFLVKTGRHPTEKEWESYKYDYKFVDSYKHAQELALEYNHRVLSIEYIQAEDVYNGTVEDTHTYFAIGNIENEKLSFTLNANCGEINLNSRQFCNLSEVVLRPKDSKKKIFEKARIATIIGTLQSAFENFRYIESAWELNQISERLLGVSLTGIMENRFTNGSLPETDIFLRELRDYTVEVNKEWAAKLGLEESKAITCVKPSGTVSQLTGVTSGIHPAFAKRYIRRIRVDKKDPVGKFLSESGYPYEVDFYNEEALVFSFLQESSARTADEFSALDQLELYRLYQKNWCHHNASISVYVNEDEWDIVGDWVYDNFDIITGVSFFPRSEHTYIQAPYEKVSEDFKLDSPEIDWDNFIEFEDETTSSQEYACAGGACEIK